MKFTWGTGIAIFYGAFMLIMIAFVIGSRNVDHSLVMDNYYEEDLKYQSRIDKLNNSNALEVDLKIEKQTEGRVLLTFPSTGKDISGEVLFYKPDDSSQDFTIPAAPDEEGKLYVDTRHLVKGLWRVKVDWVAGGTGYYKEKDINL